MDFELKYMQRCLQLACLGETGAPPNPMVGAVIVCQGLIIGEGWHRRCGGPHAEVNAIASVRQPELLTESTLYVNLEPCSHYGKTPPCADLIIEKRIPRVVVGCIDTFAKVCGQGVRRLREAGVEVVTGVLEKECRELNRRFFTFHEKQRPWLTLKWAQSEDGFIDRLCTASETPQQFSTPFTQTLVHRLRARHQAILVGTKTALRDNPSLTNRLWTGSTPLRLVIDRHNILPKNLRLFDDSAPTEVLSTGNLREILSDLHRRGIQSLLVEGGAQLLQSFLDEGLWNEARVEVAPFRLQKGVVAPQIAPSHLLREEEVDGHKIRFFAP